MTPKSIGRLTLLEYSVMTAAIILSILLLTLLLFSNIDSASEKIVGAITILIREAIDNLAFVCIQVGFVLLQIFILGGLLGEWILKHGGNSYMGSGTALFTIWVLLFVTCATTDGVMNSRKYGLQGFESSYSMWIVYGLLPFLVLGLLSSITIGYFLGLEIMKRGKS